MTSSLQAGLPTGNVILAADFLATPLVFVLDILSHLLTMLTMKISMAKSSMVTMAMLTISMATLATVMMPMFTISMATMFMVVLDMNMTMIKM